MNVKKFVAAVLPLLLCSCTVFKNPGEECLMSGQSREFFKLPNGRSAKLYQLRCADGFGVDISETVNGLLNVLCPVLVALGIINNPTNKTGI